MPNQFTIGAHASDRRPASNRLTSTRIIAVDIGIIGTGNVGGALGRRWAFLGHNVTFGSRDPESDRVKELVRRIGAGVSATSIAKAASGADIVVIATPWPATKDAIAACGDLSGKIVIDCVNPHKADFSGLEIGCDTSASEQIAGWAPGARVVKAFNATGAGNMREPAYGRTTADMPICGDDEDAKAVVRGLAEEIGFSVIDAGELTSARLLEPLAMLWIHLAYNLDQSVDIAFKLLRR
jgi:NADPH-dependent F420 reductase